MEKNDFVALISGIAAVFVIGAIVTVLLVVASGCKDAEPAAVLESSPSLTRQMDPDSEPDEKAEPTPEPTTPPIQPLAFFEMSDNLYDFTVKLDGDVFRLPLTLEVFMSYGWEPVKELSGSFNPYRYDYCDFTRNGKKAYVVLANMSMEVRDYYDSTVCGFWNLGDNYNAEIELTKNIKIGISTKDDIMAAFGYPVNFKDFNDESEYNTLKYNLEDNSNREISMELKNAKLTRIHIKNLTQIESDTTEISSEKTERELNYKAPAELGSDIKSFNVMIDGDVYHIPAPLSAFLDNGWQISEKNLEYLPGKTSSRNFTFSFGNIFQLRKGDKYIDLSDLYNYSKKPLVIENCFVVSVWSYGTRSIDIVLPGGITIGSTESELLGLHGDFLEKHSLETSQRQYSYFSGRKLGGVFNTKSDEIVISVGLEGDYTGKITTITVSNQEEE